jgi:hypothetical protein
MPFHVSNYTKSRREALRPVPLSLITDGSFSARYFESKDRYVVFIQVARPVRWIIIFTALEFSFYFCEYRRRVLVRRHRL